MRHRGRRRRTEVRWLTASYLTPADLGEPTPAPFRPPPLDSTTRYWKGSLPVDSLPCARSLLAPRYSVEPGLSSDAHRYPHAMQDVSRERAGGPPVAGGPQRPLEEAISLAPAHPGLRGHSQCGAVGRHRIRRCRPPPPTSATASSPIRRARPRSGHGHGARVLLVAEGQVAVAVLRSGRPGHPPGRAGPATSR